MKYLLNVVLFLLWSTRVYFILLVCDNNIFFPLAYSHRMVAQAIFSMFVL